MSAATGPLLHTDDWNEHEVALADNCRRTRVSPFTSIISPAARFTPFCLSFLPLFLRFLSIFFFFSQSFFITLQLQLICSGKLGPSTSLSLCLGRARVSRVRRQGAQTGGGREREQGRQREREGGRERGGERRPQANEWASCRKEAGFACDFLPSVVLCNNHHNTFSPFHTVRLIKKMAGLY